MAKGGPDIITEPYLELLKSSEGTTRYGSFFIHSDYNCPMYALKTPATSHPKVTHHQQHPSLATIGMPIPHLTAPPASADDDKLSLADWGLEYLDD